MSERLFLAQHASLDNYASIKKRLNPFFEGRWRTGDSLHATVLFLGHAFDAQQIIETVETAVYSLSDADLQGISVFGRNRILYAASEHPTLQKTHHALCEAFNLPPSKHYVAHVTLMRFKQQHDQKGFAAERHYLSTHRLGTIQGPLCLFRSHLTPEGAQYDEIYRFAR